MENELQKDFIKSDILPDDSLKIFEQFQNFKEFMMRYNCAIREVKTKFEVLNDDLSVVQNRNPIEMIKSRIKSPESLYKKLKRLNLDINFKNVEENISDIAGVRVICSFIDDIYKVAEMLAKQDDVKIIKIKDYIKNPKPNGYRSYHMIVEIPVFFSNKKQNVKVEVQLRTIAMDFWASLEHQMKYKKEINGADKLVNRLKTCADSIAEIDNEMQNIDKALESLS